MEISKRGSLKAFDASGLRSAIFLNVHHPGRTNGWTDEPTAEQKAIQP
jgi:hypothetical protein